MSDFNMIPAHRLARKRRRVRMQVWGVICGVYLVLLTAGAVTAGILFSNEGQNIAQQLAVASTQIEEHNASMLESRRELAEATTQLETWRVLQAQPDWSKLLVRLSDELGDDLVLSHCQLFACDGDSKRLTENLAGWRASKPLGTLLSECKYSLTLRGYGQSQESVSQFVLRLEAMRLFDVVRLIGSKRQPLLEMQVVAFHIECQF